MTPPRNCCSLPHLFFVCQERGSSDDEDSLSDLLGTAQFGYYLDELVDEALDEEEMEDPDATSDPLYQLNLQVSNTHAEFCDSLLFPPPPKQEYLEGFLKAFAVGNSNAFVALASHCGPLEQAHLSALFKGK